jgi:hypothetical protein
LINGYKTYKNAKNNNCFVVGGQAGATESKSVMCSEGDFINKKNAV